MSANTIAILLLTALLCASNWQRAVATVNTGTSMADVHSSNHHDNAVLDFLRDYNEKKSSTQTQTNQFQQLQLFQQHREVEENFTPTTKAYFVQLCTGYLLSDQIRGDDEISNEEAASFFEYLCDTLPKPSCQNKSIPFHSLSLMLQMQFVNAICPNDFTLFQGEDPECIARLREEVEAENDFGYIITDENKDQVDKDITEYCSNIYALSSEFHFGTYAPSVKPSFSPSPTVVQPTISPRPTKTPTISPSDYPTSSPSFPPTASPTISPRPTSIVEYETAFTYMMGFNNIEIPQTIANDGRKDIMDSTSDALVDTLTSLSNNDIFTIRSKNSNSNDNGRRRLEAASTHYWRNLQRQKFQITFASQTGNNGIRHIYQQEADCTEDFEKSSDCVIIVSEVNLQSANAKITKQTVTDVIYNTVQFAMSNDYFRDLIDIDDVIEVKYISDGNNPPSNPRGAKPLEPPIGVGGGSIAGFTIGSVVFLLLLAFFVGRARARSEDRSSIGEDELDNDYIDEDEDGIDVGSSTDDSAVISTNVDNKNKSRQLPFIQENHVESNEDQSLAQAGLQFDTMTGNVVGSAAISYASSGHKSLGSGYSADDPENPVGKLDNGDVLVDKLDEAVHAGDWAAVAAIAGDLSQADDISTISSFHSKAGDISYDPSERSGLAPQDAKRAAQIDQLIAEGDWNAVGATAAAFENEMSVDSPEKKPASPPKQQRGKSLLDFISGPWQSLAASKAAENNNVVGDESSKYHLLVDSIHETYEQKMEHSNFYKIPIDIVSDSDPETPFANFEQVGRNVESIIDDVDEEEKTAPITNVNEVTSLSDPSDLSAGEPRSPSKATPETLAALGTVGAAGAAAAAVYHSESDTTDDDRKQLISPTQKKKRSWAGRFLKRKNEKKEKVTSSSLAFQEDSSVSSWSKGEDSSPETTMHPYANSAKPADDMPAEMKAFGEDHGLAVAELAMKEEDERKQRKLNQSHISESEAELSQKSSGSLRDELDKAIETGDWAAVEKQTNQMLDEGKRNSNLLSEIESDVDSAAMEGWSQDGGPDNESEAIDDDRIEMLEKLIETDDWQGIVDDSQIHSK